MEELNREQALIRDRINRLIDDQDNDTSNYRDRIKEKGVEGAILLPIFEHFLGFDPLDDIEYEVTSSQTNSQIFDFLLDGKLVVESKAFGKPFTDEIIDQICRYIIGNDNINFGILSNGWEFAFLIQKSFIEKKYNEGESLIGAETKVLPVFTIELDNDYFYDILAAFKKQIYEETFSAIANFVYRQYVKKSGKLSPIFPDKKIDEYIKKRIEETINFKTGYYFDDIKNGRISVGDTLKFSNGNVSIPIVVLNDGTVKVEKNTVEIKNLNTVIDNQTFVPLISLMSGDWYKEDQFFIDPLDIIKLATGMQKPHRNKFEFRY